MFFSEEGYAAYHIMQFGADIEILQISIICMICFGYDLSDT